MGDKIHTPRLFLGLGIAGCLVAAGAAFALWPKHAAMPVQASTPASNAPGTATASAPPPRRVEPPLAPDLPDIVLQNPAGPNAEGAPKGKHVRLDSVPKGATVFAGKTKLGVTPLDVELSPGTNATYHFLLAGYKPASKSVSSEDKFVEVKLAKGAVVHHAPGMKSDPYESDELKDNPF